MNFAMIALALLIFALPATQNILAYALDEFVEITDRALHFPCTFLEHGKCFTLGRFDPTCLQCL
jgi:hypothetical protein